MKELKKSTEIAALILLTTGMVVAGMANKANDEMYEESPKITEPIPYEEQYDYSLITGGRREVREFSYEDAQLLMRIAQAEAGNQGTEGMELVMAVVLNRVADEDYPDTIREVIYQPHQFQPISNGSFNKVEISRDAHLALAYVEQGFPLDNNIIAFEVCCSDSLDRYFEYAYKVGNHKFYRKEN